MELSIPVEGKACERIRVLLQQSGYCSRVTTALLFQSSTAHPMRFSSQSLLSFLFPSVICLNLQLCSCTVTPNPLHSIASMTHYNNNKKIPVDHNDTKPCSMMWNCDEILMSNHYLQPPAKKVGWDKAI